MRRVAFFLVLGCSSLYGQRLIETVAGGAIQNGVPASTVTFYGLGGITGDTAGNVYLSDSGAHLLRRIRPDGIIETIAGTGISTFTGDGGPAIAASLYLPGKVVLGASGCLLLVDTNNYRIRRIDSTGTITTVAGTGIPGSLGEGGPAASAQLMLVADMALGCDGTVYFSEPGASRIRSVTPDGRMVLVAGAPQASGLNNPLSDGDGGPALSAHLAGPSALATDSLGNIYFADAYNAIRRIGPDETITTIAGAGKPQVTSLGTGDGGPASAAGFESIQGLATDGQGALYISETSADHNESRPPARIRRIAPDGTISTIAGGPEEGGIVDGPALTVEVSASALFADAQGNVYFADYSTLRRVTPAGNVETIAGGAPQPAPDGPDARPAWLLATGAMTLDRNGNIYVAESGCRIRKIAPGGALSTVAGTGNCVYLPQEGPVSTTGLPLIEDLAVTSQGMIYVSSTGGYLMNILPGGSIAVVQGVERPSDAAPDGPSYPLLRLAIDSQDRLYALASRAETLWRLSPGAAPEIFIGPGKGLLLEPIAITVDPSDNVYIADPSVRSGLSGLTTNYGHVYRISQTGTVTTLQATTITTLPNSIAVDAAGNIYGASGGFLQGFGTMSYPRCLHNDGLLASSCLVGGTALQFARTGDFYFLGGDTPGVRKISGSPPSQPPAFSAAGIVNAASLISSAIAPGELVSIFGTNLGPAVPWIAAIDNNSVPTVAGNVRVFFNNIPAPQTVATASQINAFVPYGVSSSSTAQVVVEIDGVRSSPVTVNVAMTAFGLFSADSSGSGQGAILNQDNSLNGASQPADRGSIVTFYGTGEGLTTPALPDGALVLSTPFSAPAGPVAVTIGGQAAEVLYAGAAPTLPTGVLQIDARIPAGIAPGNAAVSVSIGGANTSRTITVAVK